MMPTDLIFLVCAIATVILSILVISLKNPIYGSLSLVGSFLPVAVIYILLHAPFVAAIQILVYGGAIMVLFTFVIMMIDLKDQDLKIQKNPLYRLLSLVVVLVFWAVSMAFLQKTQNLRQTQDFRTLDTQTITSKNSSPQETPHFQLDSPVDSTDFGSVKSIGRLIFGEPDPDNPKKANQNTLQSPALVSFELSSILILVAIVGALVLTKEYRVKKNDP